MKKLLDKLPITLFCILFTATSFAFTNFVWTGSATPTAPYSSWETAAHTIQPAVDYAIEGNMVLVSNDFFNLSSHILIVTNNITLKSVDYTLLDGNYSVNCIYMRGNSTI